MCGAARPRDADRNVVSRLDRMRKIRAVSPLANTITLEAGCILQEVQEAAASADCFFPTLPPMSEELLRYGPTPDLVLGIEVVLRRSDQARRRPERP